MAYSNDQLNDIYDRTDGRCHLCSKKLAFNNYGKLGKRAAWEVEHSSCGHSSRVSPRGAP